VLNFAASIEVYRQLRLPPGASDVFLEKPLGIFHNFQIQVNELFFLYAQGDERPEGIKRDNL
jgi:hypothetical protein